MSFAVAKLNTLAALEIPYWIKRPTMQGVYLHHPRFQAKLCVLLSYPITREDKETEKILTGMLQVLNCSSSELYLSWITKNYIEGFDLETILSELKYYRSENILMLGKAFGMAFEVKRPLWKTYHPEELKNEPTLKKEAYRVLLSLKEQLEVR